MTTQARASMFRQLRGPKGFEALYQGKSVIYPIAITPTETGLDPLATEQYQRAQAAYAQNGGAYPFSVNGEGTSPWLVAGVSVPMNATATVWFPVLTLGANGINYRLQLIWRIRSQSTAQSVTGDLIPYHGTADNPGPTDDGSNNFFSGGPAGPAWSGDSALLRYPILAAQETMLYPQVEPTTQVLAQANAWGSVTVPQRNDAYQPPLFPGFAAGEIAYGEIVQGLEQDPSFMGPTHVVQELKCRGDELVILLNRDATDDDPTWDFSSSGVDALVSRYLGQGLLGNGRVIPINAGVMIATGVSL